MDWNLRVLGVAVGVRTLGNALYFPFLALFLHGVLAVGYLELGVIFFAVGVVQLPFNIAGGLWTDRYGRRRWIILGLVAEALATAGLAYAFDLRSLAGAIVAGTLGGMVISAAGPATSAYVADLAEGSERTRGFTFLRIGFNAGYSAGVTLGGILISLFGFAPAVAVAAVVIAAGAALVALVVDPSPFDVELHAGRAASRRSPSSGTGERVPTPPIAASLRALLRDRVALEVALAFAFAALFVGQWAFTFPLFVRNVLGIPYSLLGVGLAINGLVVVFGQTLTTQSVLGRRHTTIAIAGVALYAVAFIGLGAAGLWSVYPVAAFFAAVVVLTVGENLVTIPQSTLPSNLAPQGEVGLYNGAFATVGGAGFLGSIVLGGWVLSVTANPLLIWVLLALPAIPAVILLRHAAGRMPLEHDRA
ncbi:MAG: MFS transporter [Thermoplasmata archaeon]|nr:MFS transporter [Thermoplasmata archaeon]